MEVTLAKLNAVRVGRSLIATRRRHLTNHTLFALTINRTCTSRRAESRRAICTGRLPLDLLRFQRMSSRQRIAPLLRNFQALESVFNFDMLSNRGYIDGLTR